MTNFASATHRNKFRQILLEFFRVLLFVVLLLAGIAFLLNLHIPKVKQYSCDMEKVVLWKNKPHFKQEGKHFGNGQLQSEEVAHTGQFSAKTDKNNRFAAAHQYQGLTGFEVITITAWRYSKNGQKGSIVISVPNGILWQSAADVITKTTDGWEKIQLKHTIPRAAKNKTLTIYLWNSGKEIIYFDDMEVKLEQKEIL